MLDKRPDDPDQKPYYKDVDGTRKLVTYELRGNRKVKPTEVRRSWWGVALDR